MLTRYSPAREPKQAGIHLTEKREAGLSLALSARLCQLTVLMWGFLCAKRVDGRFELIRLLGQNLIDSGKSGVFWPAAQAISCCGVSLLRSRHRLGFVQKWEIWPSANAKAAVLNLPQPQHGPNSQLSGLIWPFDKAECPFIN